MEKTCQVCGQRKPIGEYYRIQANADGHDGRCKPCRRASNKQYYQEKPDKFREIRERYEVGGWAIYCLPDHNYIGMTQNVEYRMIQHRYENRNTDNVEVLHVYDRKDIAKAIEALYHHVGWEGESASGRLTSGWRWITNGEKNHKIAPGTEMPEGYDYGYVRHK